MSKKSNAHLSRTFSETAACQSAIGKFVRKLSDKPWSDDSRRAKVSGLTVHEQTGKPAFLLVDSMGNQLPGSMPCIACYFDGATE